MNIRTATLEDLDIIAEAESRCFPVAEAAGRREFEERLRVYADHFWLLFDDGKLISFIDGLVTDETDLTDEMYENVSMHNESGAWQMIFGVVTVPEARKKGMHHIFCVMLSKSLADREEKDWSLPVRKVSFTFMRVTDSLMRE